MNIIELLSQCKGFEWDKGNLEKNWIKHKVEAYEAEEIFRSHEAIYFKDEKHSLNEDRYIALGLTQSKRELFVSFTVRNFKIRIISARPMNVKERGVYEQATQRNTRL